jgi:plasmid replication initiation protein
MLEESRNTQIANEILMNLISTYKETQIKVFLATINKATTKHYAITEEENRDDIYNYDSLEVDIPLDFYKQYGLKGGYTIKQIRDIVKSINIPIEIMREGKVDYINVIDHIEYDFDLKMFTVYFKEEYFEYVILLRNSDYTVIDLAEIKKLESKYEMGLYLMYWQFITTGKRYFTIEGCKNYFGFCGHTNRVMMKYIRQALESIDDKLGYKIRVETETYNKVITNVNFSFKKGRKKV